MQRFTPWCRVICVLLSGLLLCEAAPLAALAQQAPPGRIENVRVQVNGRSSVYIDYDLIGPTEQVFKVAVMMKKQSDSSYSYVPQNVAGDVGASVYPGRNNRIVWSLARELPAGIKEGDCYFVFALEQTSGSAGAVGLPLIIAGGAAIVGGIVALILVSKKGDTGGGGTSGFPTPPGRP